MGWEDAHESRVLAWRFWKTLAGKRYAQGFARDARNKGRYAAAALYEKLPVIEDWKLLTANPIFVSEEMVDLVEAAAETFEPEPLEETDLLTPGGWVYLERPLILEDYLKRKMAIRAIAWGGATIAEEETGGSDGIVISFYSHSGDEDDFDIRGAAEDPLSETAEVFAARYPLTVAHFSPWQFGKTFSDLIGQLDKEKGLPEVGSRFDAEAWGLLWAKVQSLFRLLVQRVTTVERHQLHRKARREGKRHGFTESDAVTVVTLRRLREQIGESNREVEWQHRWIVGGHWRNQWYPSLNRHRQIWINPYVKGPSDRELLIKEVRAYELVR